MTEICLQNNKYADAEPHARTLWEIINHKHDNNIPDDQLQSYIANGAYYLALSTRRLDEIGGIPVTKKQESGQESIILARRAAKEINTQLHEIESDKVAADMLLLADLLSYFNDVVDDDDEIPRLYDQAKGIFARVQGSLSSNMAACEGNLGRIYDRRAKRAMMTNNLDRCVANLELSLPLFRETSRICRAINRVDNADAAARDASQVKEMFRLVAIARTASGSTSSLHTSSSRSSISSSSSSSSSSS